MPSLSEITSSPMLKEFAQGAAQSAVSRKKSVTVKNRRCRPGTSGGSTITLTTSPTAPTGEMSVSGPAGVQLGTTGTLSGTTLTLSKPLTANVTAAAITLGGNNVTDRYYSQVYPHRPDSAHGGSNGGGDGGPRSNLFLLIGTNNVGALAQTASTIITNLTTYTAQARTDGFKVYLGTITPRASSSALNATQESYRLVVNAAIRNGTIPSDYVLDYAQLMDAADTNYSGDGLHFVSAGQTKIVNYLLSVFLSDGNQTPASYGTISEPLIARDGITTTTLTATGTSTTAGIANTGNFASTAGAAAAVAGTIENSSASGYSALGFLDNGGTLQGYIGRGNSSASRFPSSIILSSNNSDDIDFVTGVSQRVIIKNGGDVLIGTATDDGTHLLQVNGSESVLGSLAISGTGTNTLTSSTAGVVTATLESTSTSGFSMVGFKDNSGTQHGFVGWPNASASGLTGAASSLILYGADSATPVVLGTNNAARLTVSTAGDITLNSGSLIFSTVGKTLSIKGGSNACSGAFTLSSGSATVNTTAVTANSVIHVTVKTVSGARAGNPDIVPTAGSGFAATGASTDNSTYNWWIDTVNQ